MSNNNKEYYKNFWWYKGVENPATNVHNFVYSKNDLLGAVKKFVNEFGRKPRRVEWSEMPEYPAPGTVTKHFGSWNNMIEAAGFDPYKARGGR